MECAKNCHTLRMLGCYFSYSVSSQLRKMEFTHRAKSIESQGEIREKGNLGEEARGTE